MNGPAFLKTQRLLLRRWKQADLAAFAEINADPKVMEFFPGSLSEAESNELSGRIEAAFESSGFGLWALEIALTGEFIGFTGLSVPRIQAHFMPCVEVGWRIASRHWGQGYAPEAAKEALRDGFVRVELSEIVSMTAAVNTRSVRVMTKVGMTTAALDDFLHPALPDGHRLKPHVLYRLTRKEWRRQDGS